MKIRLSVPANAGSELPDAASLAAIRAWYEGLSAREAVTRYLSKAGGQSSRGILGAIRRQLITVAKRRHREDLAALFGFGSFATAAKLIAGIETMHAIKKGDVVHSRVTRE